MLTTALQSKISSLGFKDHVSRNAKQKLSLAKAHGRINLANISRENTNLKYYMNAVSIEMGRHGFIQHYGFNGIRENKEGRTRHNPKTTTYSFKNHVYNLPQKDFIGKAIQQSGVIQFVTENIAQIRSEELLIGLQFTVE